MRELLGSAGKYANGSSCFCRNSLRAKPLTAYKHWASFHHLIRNFHYLPLEASSHGPNCHSAKDALSHTSQYFRRSSISFFCDKSAMIKAPQFGPLWRPGAVGRAECVRWCAAAKTQLQCSSWTGKKNRASAWSICQCDRNSIL